MPTVISCFTIRFRLAPGATNDTANSPLRTTEMICGDWYIAAKLGAKIQCVFAGKPKVLNARDIDIS
ncbi:MAG: hypothetical protein IJ599_03345 [Alphaproteobacteria bacterium]|nr:hypothetical protein [Alphaproteobacteria bacterium]